MDIKERRQRYTTRADRSDDPNVPHGTRGGYRLFLCSCAPCRAANNHRQSIHRKNAAMMRVTLVPKYRLVRRMEAIHFMGYTTPQIAKVAGMERRALAKLWTTQVTVLCRLDLLLKIDHAYKLLADRPIKNPTQQQRIWQQKARQRGYISAAGWNNIDDLNEKPKTRSSW